MTRAARSAKGRAWHASTCPLYEIGEHECRYNIMECDCGFDPDAPAAVRARRELERDLERRR